MGQRWGVGVEASQRHAIRTPRPHACTVTQGGHLGHHLRKLAGTRAHVASGVVHALTVLHPVPGASQPLLRQDVLLRATRNHGRTVIVVQLTRPRAWTRAGTWTMAVRALAAHGLEKLGHGGIGGKISESTGFPQLLGGAGPHVWPPHAPLVDHVVDHVVAVVVAHSRTSRRLPPAAHRIPLLSHELVPQRRAAALALGRVEQHGGVWREHWV